MDFLDLDADPAAPAPVAITSLETGVPLGLENTLVTKETVEVKGTKSDMCFPLGF